MVNVQRIGNYECSAIDGVQTQDSGNIMGGEELERRQKLENGEESSEMCPLGMAWPLHT